MAVDADYASGDDFRVIQVTPPGSGCSVIFGKNVIAAAPGSAQGLHLIVSDIEAARNELLAASRSARCSTASAACTLAPTSLTCLGGSGSAVRTPAWQLLLVRLVQRSGRQRLAVPGGHDAAARSHRPRDDDLRVGERSRERASACGGRARAA